MSNWKENITPGECGLFKAKKHHEPSLTAIDKLFVQPEWAEREFSDIICEINHEGRTENQQMADGKLIEETFNVTNETGKTPRELKQERDEAIDTLRAIEEYCDDLVKRIENSELHPVLVKDSIDRILGMAVTATVDGSTGKRKVGSRHDHTA